MTNNKAQSPTNGEEKMRESANDRFNEWIKENKIPWGINAKTESVMIADWWLKEFSASPLALLEQMIGENSSRKVEHQEFENNTGKLHCDPVTEICEITAYNSAIDDINTDLRAKIEELKKTI